MFLFLSTGRAKLELILSPNKARGPVRLHEVFHLFSHTHYIQTPTQLFEDSLSLQSQSGCSMWGVPKRSQLLEIHNTHNLSHHDALELVDLLSSLFVKDINIYFQDLSKISEILSEMFSFFFSFWELSVRKNMLLLPTLNSTCVAHRFMNKDWTHLQINLLIIQKQSCQSNKTFTI